MLDADVAVHAATTFGLLVALQLALARLPLGREARRNVQHWSTGQAFLAVSYLLPQQVCVGLLLAAAALLYHLEVHRRALFLRHFGAFLRPAEARPEAAAAARSGALHFLLGTAAVAACVPLGPARFALQCLATVDPVAAAVGRAVPSPRLTRSATLAGSAAGLAAGAAVGCLYLGRDRPWYVILVGALTCTLVEASPYGNDNFLIPVLTGLATEAAARAAAAAER